MRVVVAFFLIFVAATHLHAHGLVQTKSKTIMFEERDQYLVKVELTPNSVHFNQPNKMVVSIIDVAGAHFYQNPVQIDIGRLGAEIESLELARNEFPKGLFKTEVPFESGGEYRLDLILVDETSQPFSFKFTLQDNKRFARSVIYVTLLCTLLFFGAIAFLRQQRNVSDKQFFESKTKRR